MTHANTPLHRETRLITYNVTNMRILYVETPYFTKDDESEDEIQN